MNWRPALMYLIRLIYCISSMITSEEREREKTGRQRGIEVNFKI